MKCPSLLFARVCLGSVEDVEKLEEQLRGILSSIQQELDGLELMNPSD